MAPARRPVTRVGAQYPYVTYSYEIPIYGIYRKHARIAYIRYIGPQPVHPIIRYRGLSFLPMDRASLSRAVCLLCGLSRPTLKSAQLVLPVQTCLSDRRETAPTACRKLPFVLPAEETEQIRSRTFTGLNQ